jgi:hypothetical protein
MATTRRQFIGQTMGAAATLAVPAVSATVSGDVYAMVARSDRSRILTAADTFLAEEPVTVTAAHSDRSAGGLHDYFSEGDYWWPDPKNPGGPYIRRDGFSNPANFNTSREALIRLGIIAPTLAAAWRLTKHKKYLAHFNRHLYAWFVDPATKMNPNLEYAQAISGVSKGRDIGIIDTLHIMEMVRAIRVLEAAGGISPAEIDPIRAWFASYAEWMSTSKNGVSERDQKNNHASCWVLQIAEFAQFTHRDDLVALCVDHFKTMLVPGQIAQDGSLPLELARTKPYGYSIFDCDVLSGICQSLSTARDNLWTFKGPNGKGVGDTVAFLYPYLADKSKWPYSKDVEYFDVLPSRRPCLLFAGEALARREYIALWQRTDANPTKPEVIRNLPIRQPLLWVDPVLKA